ncbi:hypothetical protein [Bradyrhizobium sp. JR3.5]
MVTLIENGERRTGLQLSQCTRAFTVSQESEDPVINVGAKVASLARTSSKGFVERMVTCSTGMTRVECSALAIC